MRRRALVDGAHRALGALAVLAVLAYAGHVAGWLVPHPDGHAGDAVPLAAGFVVILAFGAVRTARAGRRTDDVVLTVGLTLDALGWIWWAALLAPMADPPYPSVADGLWMGFFPCAFVALAWHVGRGGAARAAFTMDVLIGSAGVTAAVAGLLVPAIVAGGGSAQTVGVNAVYLGASVAHLVLLLSVLALHGFRHRGLLWSRVAAAAVLSATNSVFLLEVADTGAVPVGEVLDLGWLVGSLLMVLSLGAARAEETPGERARWAVTVVPLTGTVLALAVLVTEGRDVAAARWVAGAAVLLALARMALALAQAHALAGSHELALTDELTGLTNRRGFGEAVRRALAQDQRFTLVLLDLNRFKEVNDTLGHRAGDVLLVLVARRLTGAVRSAGRRDDVVARLGGDEFALLLRRADAQDGVVAARRLTTTLGRSYEVEGLTVRASAAAGVVHAPEHGTDLDTLLRRADVAMYAAKAAHEPLVVHTPALDTRGREDLVRVEHVRASLIDGGLVVHYQPKVDLRTGAVVGAEALARLRDARGGLLLPGEFLDALGQGGLLRSLTTQVLDRAVGQAAAWQRAGTPLAVAVNVSADDVLDGDLAAQVAIALARHDLPGELLSVEVTEEVLLHDHAAGRAGLEAVRALGVRVSVDDFGTGYSSLSYLRDLPLDELKLDRSFVRGMVDDVRATRIVEAIIALAHALDLGVVAEGVETEAHRLAVLAAGCDLGQGYLFARPVPPEEVLAVAGHARAVARGPAGA